MDAMYTYGLVPVVAAGNSAVDACTASPAGGQGSITVGSTAINDAVSYFSNRGKCVSLQAPGSEIVAAFPNQPSGSIGNASLSGTSMASPHVAGAVAVAIDGARSAHLRPLARAMKSAVTCDATPGTIQASGSSVPSNHPDLLLHLRPNSTVPMPAGGFLDDFGIHNASLQGLYPRTSCHAGCPDNCNAAGAPACDSLLGACSCGCFFLGSECQEDLRPRLALRASIGQSVSDDASDAAIATNHTVDQVADAFARVSKVFPGASAATGETAAVVHTEILSTSIV